MVLATVLAIYGSSLCALPARQSRAAFVQAIREARYFENGWTPEQVRALLGPPDDVWPETDSIRWVEPGETIWCYGTNGHHTIPTLGRISFRQGKTLYAFVEKDPPSPSIISEQELVEGVRFLGKPTIDNFYDGSDPLRLIRTANFLRNKGQVKALAIMNTYGHLAIFDGEWMRCLSRTLFDIDGNWGDDYRISPDKVSKPVWEPFKPWPTYPVNITDGIPFSFYETASGFRMSFCSVMQRDQLKWHLRRQEFLPPPDPFVSADKAITNQNWPGDAADAIRKETLSLVRTVYRPKQELVLTGAISSERFEEYHQKFLALNSSWDSKQQCYVRRHVKILQDKFVEYPKSIYQLKLSDQVRFSLSLYRDNPHGINYFVNVNESGSTPIKTFVLEVEDSKTHKIIRWDGVNDFDEDRNSRHRSIESELAKPAHTPRTSGSGFGGSFYAQEKLKFRIIVLYEGKRYSSPTYKI